LAKQVDAPDLQELFRDFNLQVPWHPKIPEAYIVRPRPAPTSTAQDPLTPARVAPPGPGRTPLADPASRGSHVVNNTPNPVYAPWKDRKGKLRDVLKPLGLPEVHPPRTDTNTEMCITWHVKGSCNTLCGRCADHKPQSAAEATRLTQWCQAHPLTL
jgi:hypothetical protein